MQSMLQTACEWTRIVHPRQYEDGSEGTVTRYRPGSVSVEYRRDAEGRCRVERVLVYSSHDDPRRRRLRTTHTKVPVELQGSVRKIVRENERNFYRYRPTILLPRGSRASSESGELITC